MKGKQGNAAQARRDWAGIVQERDDAVRLTGKLEAEFADERAAWARRQASLETEIGALRVAARDVTTPVIEQLRESLERMRVERQEALDQAERATVKQGRIAERTIGFMAEALGITKVEAMEYVVGFIGGVGEGAVKNGQVLIQTAFVDDKLNARIDRGELTYEQAVQIDNARHGRRRHAGYDSVFDVVVNGPEPTGDLGPLTRDVAAAAAGPRDARAWKRVEATSPDGTEETTR